MASEGGGPCCPVPSPAELQPAPKLCPWPLYYLPPGSPPDNAGPPQAQAIQLPCSANQLVSSSTGQAQPGGRASALHSHQHMASFAEVCSITTWVISGLAEGEEEDEAQTCSQACQSFLLGSVPPSLCSYCPLCLQRTYPIPGRLPSSSPGRKTPPPPLHLHSWGSLLQLLSQAQLILCKLLHLPLPPFQRKELLRVAGPEGLWVSGARWHLCSATHCVPLGTSFSVLRFLPL